MQSEISPTSITILPTYKCNAACEQCCFQSSPRLKQRLAADVILDRIHEAAQEFKTLRQVIFSGGEALLLKDDLHAALRLSRDAGLATRLVSNGFWGKRESTAAVFAEELRSSGLSELNISTGLDHQRYVPERSVIQAAKAAVSVGIPTLITVEVDSVESNRLESLLADEEIEQMRSGGKLRVISNSWMPYEDGEAARHAQNSKTQLEKGCPQIFGNLTIRPDDHLSACCGLTLEKIPEMNLGRNTGSNMRAMYEAQLDDLMKVWLHLDGPYRILQKVLPDSGRERLEGVVHICQACTILHRDAEVASRAKQMAQLWIEEIVSRFKIKVATDKRVNAIQKERVNEA